MSYSDVTGHHSMVFDNLRNAAYTRALQKVVGPTTTVMDLGAGLGVHGLSAAMLGAAKVHLVEPAPVLEVAGKVAADNGLNNVHCHNCRAEELELDGKVDVLVSVFTGNFLLTEDLLPSLELPSVYGMGLDAVFWLPDEAGQWMGGYVLLDVDDVEAIEVTGCEGASLGCDGEGTELDIESILGCDAEGDALGCGEDATGCEGGDTGCVTSGRRFHWPTWRFLMLWGTIGLLWTRRWPLRKR